MGVRYQIGTYAATVTETAVGESKNGTPHIAVRFSIDGEKSATGEVFSCQRGQATLYLYFGEKSIEYAARDLRKLGYPHRGFSMLSTHNFAGTQFDAYCDHDVYNNEQKEKWGVSMGIRPLEVKPIAADKLRKLDAQFGKYLSDTPPPAAAKAAPPKTNGLVSQPRHHPPAELPEGIDESTMPPTPPYVASDEDLPF